MKKSNPIILAVIAFICLCLFCFNSSAQTKKSVKKQTLISSTKDACGNCKGTGKVLGNKTCTNCASWSEEYRKKVPCHVCKDTRYHGTEIQTCFFCNGSGKSKPFDEETQKLLDDYMKKLQQKQ